MVYYVVQVQHPDGSCTNHVFVLNSRENLREQARKLIPENSHIIHIQIFGMFWP